MTETPRHTSDMPEEGVVETESLDRVHSEKSSAALADKRHQIDNLLIISDQDTDPWELAETIGFLIDNLSVKRAIVDISSLAGIITAERIIYSECALDVLSTDFWEASRETLKPFFAANDDHLDIMVEEFDKYAQRVKSAWNNRISTDEALNKTDFQTMIIPGSESLIITEFDSEGDTPNISVSFDGTANTPCAEAFRHREKDEKNDRLIIVFPSSINETEVNSEGEEVVSSLRMVETYNLSTGTEIPSESDHDVITNITD